MYKRALIVDDCPITQVVVGSKLMEKKFDIVQAVDAEAGYAALSSQDFDVVILDIQLPQDNGFEFLDKMREHKKAKGYKIIVLSSHRGKDVEEFCISKGADGFVGKPFRVRPFLKKMLEVGFETCKGR